MILSSNYGWGNICTVLLHLYLHSSFKKKKSIFGIIFSGCYIFIQDRMISFNFAIYYIISLN